MRMRETGKTSPHTFMGKRRGYCWTALGVTILLTVTAPTGGSTAGAASSITTCFDLPYAANDGSDPRATSLDVYGPAGGQNLPVIVYLHGGSWCFGDKRDAAALPTYFAGVGYLFVSVNYRLAPAVQYPANVQDVAGALAWVHDHIAGYGGDPGSIFLLGYSAGGHLAALAGTDERRLAAWGKDLTILRGVVLLDNSCYDVPLLMQNPDPTGLLGLLFGPDPAVWRDATPVGHVAPGKQIPPFLLVFTSEFKRPQIEAFAAALRKAGGRAEFLAAAGKNHQTVVRDLGAAGDGMTQAIMGFLRSLR